MNVLIFWIFSKIYYNILKIMIKSNVKNVGKYVNKLRRKFKSINHGDEIF
jgi:hypothetical protein